MKTLTVEDYKAAGDEFWIQSIGTFPKNLVKVQR